jgi:hypothetical protein
MEAFIMSKPHVDKTARISKKPQASLRLELSGTVIDDLCSISSACAGFVSLSLSLLGEILMELKDMSLRWLRKQRP